ncbi:MAG: MEROPS family M03B metallopeptidase [Candidatus Nanosalina sp. J07AB43]|nr:MAG: MEROPS family M03B metallopeptidase [Candidatus Nanosalina sp. J07AB43]
MVRERKEIDDQYKWDLETLFSSDEEWEESFHQTSERIDNLKEFEGKLTDSASNLKQYLKLRNQIKKSIEEIRSYARKRYDEDTRRDKYQGMKSRAETLSSKFSSATSFFSPEIQDAGRERINQLIEQEQGLSKYRHFFDDLLRYKSHTRSQEVEHVLASLGDVLDAPDSSYESLMNADMEFPKVERPDGEEVEITQGNFTKLLKEDRKEFRQKVYREFYDQITSFENTIASNFEKNIKRNVKMAQIKNFDSARKASIFKSNIPVDVYDNLVETVESNLDALHDHLELKKEVLGQDELGPEDVYMPVSSSNSPEIEYDRAKEMVLEAVKPLGEGYHDKAEQGLNNGWVDVYENKGKRSGAYSSSTYRSSPYILMNYQDDVSSMYTLAHELGHSMHSHFSSKNQPFVYYGYSIFAAEVASTVNEALLTRHLLESDVSDRLKKHALSHHLENFRNTLYRQTMFAHFEQKAHSMVENGGALTSNVLDTEYSDLKQRYHKPVNLDERIEKEWMRIPHFYYNFYVYQYATGISAAETLVEKILEHGPEDYIEFLSKGSAEYPVDALKDAGVDMTSEEPVKMAIQTYKQQIEQARSKI